MIKEENLGNYKIKYNYIENNNILGFIIIEITDVINIIDVFTYEEYRNKGICTKLLKYIINKYNKKFMLEVRIDNIKAINLYKKLGFIVIHKRIKYYKDVDALIMELGEEIMEDVYILAIESSCDETSVSIVKNGCVDIVTVVNSQIDIHKIYGGVVPEVASRLHLENITLVIDEALKKSGMKISEMSAIAVTYSPGLLGSLLVGLEAAKAISMVYNKPLIKVNHMMGHICANNIGKKLEYPLISLIISGGHTDLIYMKDENSFSYIGSTLDDAVGECFDKVARILEMPYPGGPNIEKLAINGKDVYPMPDLLKDNSCNFSFSGIKSHVNNLVHNAKQRNEEINKENMACSFQNAVTRSLVEKTRKALKDYNIKNLSIAGGVAANSFIRNAISKMCEEENVKFFMPEKKYCTDNGTMIGAAAYILYKNKKFASLDTNASSHEELDVNLLN